jgi:hypothetical protein
MENEETKTVPKSWAMVGGDGPRSYAQNSSYQVYSLSLKTNLNRTLLCRVQLRKAYLLISAEGTVGRRE